LSLISYILPALRNRRLLLISSDYFRIGDEERKLLSDTLFGTAIGACIGACVGALAAFVTTKMTAKNQAQIAALNADKDIRLQQDRLIDVRIQAEVALERQELKRLHLILSRVTLENSQTMSHIQSDGGMELPAFRDRYLENCRRLHHAQAIADIYYPKMGSSVRDIYGQSSMFWGHQEGVLRTDPKTNQQVWHLNMSEVVKAGDAIAKHSRNLQYKISERGEKLKQLLRRPI
jgi:gas vesicle protein